MNPLALTRSLGSSANAEVVALGPVHAMLTTTEGSLAVDEACRVLDAQDRAVAGLYAVGCMGQGGMLLRGHGLHLAWAFTSGRVAGQHAAAAARQTSPMPTPSSNLVEQGT
jgi:fumarate reductase flavoprotein subunit